MTTSARQAFYNPVILSAGRSPEPKDPFPSLPLEGKVPSAREADEVVCEAELYICNAAARLHLISQLR